MITMEFVLNALTLFAVIYIFQILAWLSGRLEEIEREMKDCVRLRDMTDEDCDDHLSEFT